MLNNADRQINKLKRKLFKLLKKQGVETFLVTVCKDDSHHLFYAGALKHLQEFLSLIQDTLEKMEVQQTQIKVKGKRPDYIH